MIYKQIDANSRDFFDSRPGYYMKDKSEQVESLCLEKEHPGADLSDNNLEFKCDLIDEMGLGTIIATEKITVKIFGKSITILIYLFFCNLVSRCGHL